MVDGVVRLIYKIEMWVSRMLSSNSKSKNSNGFCLKMFEESFKLVEVHKNLNKICKTLRDIKTID